MPSGITVEEVWRRLEDLKSETDKRFDGIHNHVDRRFDEVMKAMKEMAFIPRGEYEARHVALRREMEDHDLTLNHRLDKIEERESWRSRLIVTTVISAIVSVIVAVLILAIQLTAR